MHESPHPGCGKQKGRRKCRWGCPPGPWFRLPCRHDRHDCQRTDFWARHQPGGQRNTRLMGSRHEAQTRRSGATAEGWPVAAIDFRLMSCRYGAAGQSAVARQRIAGFGVQPRPLQLLATDDKETAILHNFCHPVIFTVSVSEITGFRGKFRTPVRCMGAIDQGHLVPSAEQSVACPPSTAFAPNP